MVSLISHDLSLISPTWLLVAAALSVVVLCMLVFRCIQFAKKAPFVHFLEMLSGLQSNLRIYFACILVAVALARPYFGETTTHVKIPSASRYVLIGLDVSLSMLVDDVKPSRLERAKFLIRQLLDSLAGEHVGLLLFAGTAFLQCPLSTDHDVLRDVLADIHTGYIPYQGTDYDSMLRTAIESFPKKPNSVRILIILSDGETHDESWRTHLPALTRSGISVVALGIGTEQGGLVRAESGGFEKHPDGRPVLSRIDSKTLMELASATGGIYLNASQLLDLSSVIQQIESRLSTSQPLERKVSHKAEVFHWFLLCAVLFICWALLQDVPVYTFRRKLPSWQLTALIQKDPTPLRLQAQKYSSWSLLFAGSFLLLNGTSYGTQNHFLILQNQAVSHVEDATQQNFSYEQLRTSFQQIVKSLSQTKDSLTAVQYASFARMTLNYLEAVASRLPAQTIRDLALDGLDAVSRGSALNSSIANWKHLRDSLSRWLEPPPAREDYFPAGDLQQKASESSDSSAQLQSLTQQIPNTSPLPKHSLGQTPPPACHQRPQHDTPTHSQHPSQQETTTPLQNRSPNTPQHLYSDARHDKQPTENDVLGSIPTPHPQNSRQQKNNTNPQVPLQDPTSSTADSHAEQLHMPQTHTRRIGGQHIHQVPRHLRQLAPDLQDVLELLELARQNDTPSVLFKRMLKNEKQSLSHTKNW